MLRMLELGMRKARPSRAPLAAATTGRRASGRGASGPTSPTSPRNARARTTRVERAKAEKAMAESGDGWRPGAHDEALDSLLDRFDDDDDPIVMRELAPTPEVTFDVADMPEAPPDGRPRGALCWAAAGRAAISRRAAGHVRRAARRDRRRARGALPDALALKTGDDGVAAARATSSPTWYGDAREGEAKRHDTHQRRRRVAARGAVRPAFRRCARTCGRTRSRIEFHASRRRGRAVSSLSECC